MGGSGSARRTARRLAHEVTPPAAARAVRGVARRLRGTSGADTRVPVPSDRVECGPDFYDQVFEDEERWKLPYWKMQWYASWAVISDRVILSESPKVLDIGCGTGQLGRILCDRGLSDFTGFDFSHKRLEHARSLVPEFRFEIADAYTTDLFETVDYNIVTCCEFLEHLEGDLEVLARVPRGTRVLGTVPSYNAKAHLRYFADEAEVAARYGECIAHLRIDRIHNTGSGCEFLIDGRVA